MMERNNTEKIVRDSRREQSKSFDVRTYVCKRFGMTLLSVKLTPAIFGYRTSPSFPQP
jgi:hypothetical protein